tara:strand:- start:564 stop:953 length:390 start_codon:yes stop_codon:yes gene_type:complete
MTNCDTCGTPAKIIKSNRQLSAHNDDLLEQCAQLKKELSATKKELRRSLRKEEKSKALASSSVNDLKMNKVEMKVMHRQILRLEERVKGLEWDNRAKKEAANNAKEKLKHIAEVASTSAKWLKHGCRYG